MKSGCRNAFSACSPVTGGVGVEDKERMFSGAKEVSAVGTDMGE